MKLFSDTPCKIPLQLIGDQLSQSTTTGCLYIRNSYTHIPVYISSVQFTFILEKVYEISVALYLSWAANKVCDLATF